MMISQLSQATGLTRKAILYYTEQGLLHPTVGENGYRQYSEEDAIRLRRIAMLRKLNVGLSDIAAILADPSGTALKTVILRQKLQEQRNAEKRQLLVRLSNGAEEAEISAALAALDCNQTITERLLDAFPGHVGQVFCLHFARFLNEPIRTEDQQHAYRNVLDFLDNLPPFDPPQEVRDFLSEAATHLSVSDLSSMEEGVRRAAEAPEDFLQQNREIIARYLAFRQSKEYRASPAAQLTAYMKDFQQASGYTEVFIPAMQQLSPAYASHLAKLRAADDYLLTLHPELIPSK